MSAGVVVLCSCGRAAETRAICALKHGQLEIKMWRQSQSSTLKASARAYEATNWSRFHAQAVDQGLGGAVVPVWELTCERQGLLRQAWRFASRGPCEVVQLLLCPHFAFLQQASPLPIPHDSPPLTSHLSFTNDKGVHGGGPFSSAWLCMGCLQPAIPSPAQRTPMHAPQRLLPSLKARPVYRHPPPAPQPQQPHKTRQVPVRPARGRRGEALPSGRVHHAVFETRASDFIQRTAHTSGRARHTYPRPPKCGPVRTTPSSHSHSCTYFRIHILQGAPCFAQERVHLGESGSRSLERKTDTNTIAVAATTSAAMSMTSR